MRMHKKYSLWFMTAVLATLLMSACTQVSTGSTQSNLSPLQVMQKSAAAMSQLKSSHEDIKSTDNIQTSSNTGSKTTGSSVNLNVTANGSGDQTSPDQQQLNLTVNALNQVTNESEIVVGDKVYVKDNTGKWYVIDKSTYIKSAGKLPTDVSINQNEILGMLQHVKINDHGAEQLNGQSLRHITASLDKTALAQLLNEDAQIKSTLGQQNITTLLNSTKSLQASVDFWIDEKQFYLHRTELKVNMNADGSALATTTATKSSSVATMSLLLKVDAIVDLSKFNQSITITAPANATPVSDPASIISSGQKTPAANQ